jgi:LacI family transcriptional regulator
MPVPSSIERANRVLFFWGAITGGVQSMAKHNAYTMRDVARLADVSVSTVSAVVNDKGVVSPELTKRVEQAIEAVGFYPNRGARGLRTGRIFIVGLVVPDATNPFFVEVMRGVEDEALRNGYEVIVCNSNDNLNLERRNLESLQAQRVDGILFAPSDSYVAREVLARLQAPVVFVDCIPIKAKVRSVVTDNLEAAYKATGYLISLNHQRIALISGRLVHSTSIDRAEGYRKAMQEANLPILEKYLQYGDSHIESGYQIGLNLFKSSDPPTAIFSLNNRMTLGILRALRELGIACPDRVSVLTFDDPDWAAVFNPSITSIEQPTHEIGKRAVELLLQSIRAAEEEVEVKAAQFVLKSLFQIRESTGPAPKA